MGVVQRFERRLAGLVQGAFAKAFGGWVEPGESAAAPHREAGGQHATVPAGRAPGPRPHTRPLGTRPSPPRTAARRRTNSPATWPRPNPASFRCAR